MFSYALVDGKIIQYITDSIKYIQSKYDPDVVLVMWKSVSGSTGCIEEDHFRVGSFEELQEIVNSERAKREEETVKALNRFSHASTTKKKLVVALVDSGYKADDLNNAMLNEILAEMKPYFRCHRSFEEAYFDYMH